MKNKMELRMAGIITLAAIAAAVIFALMQAKPQ